jgi:NAD(P)-dependent dehydrogenase (short-subunit alcohol dehydrogenase family)
MGVWTQWSQFFPPKPAFTDADLAPQDGKVFLVTGGYSGIGYELARILYQAHGRVYIAGPSEERGRQALQEIQRASPDSRGVVQFLHLELDDLSSIKASVEKFLCYESKLDVLWNNAGVSQPPLGSASKQGFELQMATNCLGPFLLTKLLLPILAKTSASQPPSSVRVVWISTQMVDLSAPLGGLVLSELHEPPSDPLRNYINSKFGNWCLASELSRRVGPSEGIISVALNPGAAATNLFRHKPFLNYLAWPLLYSPKFTAYTELFAGLSEEINMERNGCYIFPWGRVATESMLRKDLLDAVAGGKEEGGKAEELWAFCEQKTQPYC